MSQIHLLQYLDLVAAKSRSTTIEANYAHRERTEHKRKTRRKQTEANDTRLGNEL